MTSETTNQIARPQDLDFDAMMAAIRRLPLTASSSTIFAGDFSKMREALDCGTTPSEDNAVAHLAGIAIKEDPMLPDDVAELRSEDGTLLCRIKF